MPRCVYRCLLMLLLPFDGLAAAQDTPGLFAQANGIAQPGSRSATPFLSPPHSDLPMPVALSGFCAVALRDHQKWVLGKEEHQILFDGKFYRFEGPRQWSMFAAAPTRYVPALAGDCVVTFADTGRRVAGDPHYGLVSRGRLYFFAGPPERDTFRAAVDRYVDADLANEGQCLVTLVEENRRLPGIPKTALTVDGIRYLFAGAFQRAKFASNMSRYGVQRRESEHHDPKSPADHAKPLPKPDGQTDPTTAAMDGYCPVSIHEQGIWLLGKTEYEARHDGKLYRLAGEDERNRFLSDPRSYLPVLGGDCPVTNLESGERVAGSVRYPLEYDGRLYLFASAEEKRAFKAAPASFANVDLGAEGNCLVTKVEEGNLVAGLPEYVSWYLNRRYLFASPEKKARFDAQPLRYFEQATKVNLARKKPRRALGGR